MIRRLAQLLGSVIIYGGLNTKISQILFRQINIHNILFSFDFDFTSSTTAYNKKEHLKILFKRKGNVSSRKRCYLSTPNSGNL